MVDSKKRRRKAFAYDSDNSFTSLVSEIIKTHLDTQRDNFLDSRNVHRYRHGHRWVTKVSATDNDSTELKATRAEHTVYPQDIIDHKIDILDGYINTFVKQLSGSFSTEMYRTLGEAAELSGNTVDLKQHSNDFAAGFLEMLRKIEIGVDRFGRPTMPQIHAPPEMAAKFLATLKKQPKEYSELVEELKAEKEKMAIRREAHRISRFRWA